MQISSALLSEQPGSLFHQPFLSSFHPLCYLNSMALICHGLSLLNETASLKKKGQFEGSSSGLPQPEFPSGPVQNNNDNNKNTMRQLLRKAAAGRAKSI